MLLFEKKAHRATIQMRSSYLALLLFGGLRCIPGSMALRLSTEGGREARERRGVMGLAGAGEPVG